jgi:ribosomal protection tetracycline resistance protein
MTLLNLGIVAHVDAGKTSLTERLLYEAGVIGTLGSVDEGTTSTDSMDLERRRGITIRAAVTSFALNDLDVNLLDTPGHPDFIAEVERSLTVLDAAVLVVSAVEGVQPQTVVLWRALQRTGVPTVLFINKVDRTGANVARVLDQVRSRLTRQPVLLARATAEGTRQVSVQAVALEDESVVQAIAEVDDRVLACWFAGRAVGSQVVLRALRQGVRRGTLTPVVCGSAITGAGTPQLRWVFSALLPRAGRSPAPGGAAATVFAVDHDGCGRRAWLRMWSGELRVRDRVAVVGQRPERITEIAISRPGGSQRGAMAHGGQVVVVRGPSAWRVGDVIGSVPKRLHDHRFPPPTLQALVEPIDPRQRGELFAALGELADEDPLIDLRIDETDSEAAISLHGEVQKEVISALLEERYAVRARFLDVSVVCIERVVGTGAALEQMKVDGNPYLATIGLRVEAAPIDHGVEFSSGIERGNLPAAFVAATEEGVRAALRQGLHGWAVTDCVVTMTDSGYCPRQSHAHQRFNKSMSSIGADFRNLAPVVALAALQQAGTRVCEPVDRFDLDVPQQSLAPVAALLARLGATTVESTAAHGWTRLVGHIASAQAPGLARQVPELTSGEGVLVARLDHHAPAVGEVPSHRRSGVDPRDRATWFRKVPR